jgi:hypothetical protein
MGGGESLLRGFKPNSRVSGISTCSFYQLLRGEREGAWMGGAVVAVRGGALTNRNLTKGV